jgi:hypothetical protein
VALLGLTIIIGEAEMLEGTGQSGHNLQKLDITTILFIIEKQK